MKQHIKQIAIDMANANGLINLTRFDLCERAEIPEGSFPHVMGCTFTEFVTELKPHVNDDGNHTANKRRANPELRKEQILNAAIIVAKKNGYNKLTKPAIAETAGTSVSLVGHYFPTMPQLKRAVMRAAIAQGIIEIIANGLANKDQHARKAPKELKTQAAQLIANL